MITEKQKVGMHSRESQPPTTQQASAPHLAQASAFFAADDGDTTSITAVDDATSTTAVDDGATSITVVDDATSIAADAAPCAAVDVPPAYVSTTEFGHAWKYDAGVERIFNSVSTRV